jgi:hypothetical protein
MVTALRFVRALGGVVVGGVLLGACSLGGGSSTSTTSTTINTAQTTFRTIPFTPTTDTTLPAGAPGASTTAVPGSTDGGVYTVKAGDAWVSIARKLGVDAAARPSSTARRSPAHLSGRSAQDPAEDDQHDRGG